MNSVTDVETRASRPGGPDGMRTAALWLIGVALSALAVTYAVDKLGGGAPVLDGRAWAQPVASGGSRGVFAFTGQMTKNTFGVYVVDVDAMTMWAYEYEPQKSCMRLAAARTWRYDRYLENYNNCGLSPEDVERIVEEQRRYRIEGAGENVQQEP